MRSEHVCFIFAWMRWAERKATEDLAAPADLLRRWDSITAAVLMAQGLNAFHCCLEVSKVEVKVFERLRTLNKSATAGRRGLPASQQAPAMLSYYTLSLVPPIVLENMLPYTVILRIFEGHSSQPEVPNRQRSPPATFCPPSVEPDVHLP